MKLAFLFQGLRIGFYRMLSDLRTKGKIYRHQPVHAVGAGVLSIEGKVHIGVFPSPHFMSSHAYLEARHPGSSLSIGDGTWINNGFTAIAEFTSISIGNRCLIGTQVEIMDSDFHGLQLADRNQARREWCRSVAIEDDVFLGSNTRIMKGVTVGRGSVVANGSIVTSDIPPFSVAGGNPARVIKSLDPIG